MKTPSLLAAFLLFVASAPSPSTPAVAKTVSPLPALEQHLESNFEGRKIPGAAMAVIQDGRLVMARGFGSTRSSDGETVGPGTLFRIGSTTKMFVAATALTLVEEGRLDLDRPISAYVPGLPARLGRLTMQQLLTHTAGLFDDAPMQGPGDDGALGRMVRGWNDDAVFLEPGRFFSYSNPGYWLAGYVIECVDGRSFADAVKARVLDPLGMKHSTFRPEEAERFPHAGPHNGKGSEIRPAPNHAGTWPSGSLYSSVNEMAMFLRALLDDGMLDGRRVLAPGVARRLKTSCVDVVEPRHQRYGYGVMHRAVDGEAILFHSGGRAGYGSYVLMVPSRRFASVTLTNRSSTMLSDWNRTAVERLLGITIPESDRDEETRETLLESEFRPLLGVYVNPPALRYELFNWKVVPWTREGGQLFLKRGMMRMAIHQVGPDRFSDDAITFALTRDSRGEPRWLHAEYKTLVRKSGRPRGR